MERYLACGELDLGVFDRVSWIAEQVRTLSRSQLLEADELNEAAEALKSIVEVSSSPSLIAHVQGVGRQEAT